MGLVERLVARPWVFWAVMTALSGVGLTLIGVGNERVGVGFVVVAGLVLVCLYLLERVQNRREHHRASRSGDGPDPFDLLDL